MKLNSMEEKEEHHKILETALKEYHINYDKISFLQHSENITFSAENKNNQEKYLIRIHKSINEDYSYYQDNIGLINSELLLLTKLNSCGIKVQSPIKNKNCSYVTQVFSKLWNKTVNVTILQWVNGEDIDINEKNYKELAYNFGKEMARMHKCLSQWEVPKEFTRQEYDLRFLKNNMIKLEKLVDNKIISREIFNYINKACAEIIEFIDKNLSKKENWGLIHGDLTEGNYVVSEKSIFFIDFSMSGFGYYLNDIGQTLMHLSIENRKLFIKGYEDTFLLPNNYERFIEAFFIMAIIDNMLFLASSEEEHEHVSKLANYLSNNLIKKFLSNTKFIFGS